MIRLSSLFETKQLYTDVLAKYKTVGAKKACMTRDIKSHESFIADVKEAVERPHATGWYLGEKYNGFHLKHYQKELALLQRIRAELSTVVA